MASEKKKLKPPVYNDPGWGDSLSVSKKALQELAENSDAKDLPSLPDEEKPKKKTASLKEYANYSGPTKKTARLVNTSSSSQSKPTESKSEINSQVDQINGEISRAISEIEGVMEKFVNQLLVEIKNFGLASYNLFLKVILLVFVQPLKNASKISVMLLSLVNDSLEDFNNFISGKPTKAKIQAKQAKKGTAVLKEAVKEPEPQVQPQQAKVKEEDVLQKQYPDVFDGIVFSELAKKGIVFLNIKNTDMYDLSKKHFTVEEDQDLLKRAIKEINDCARLAKSLPSPTKGRYLDMPMEDILKNVQMEDLKRFLQYVYTHPKPFVEKRLRLSEAFATWAHKGAPV